MLPARSHSLTSAAVVIPKAMAYATIAGLPVEVGLYTAFVPMIIYAVLGTSRPLSVSTTTTLAILTSADLSRATPNGNVTDLLRASATLALLVGAILVRRPVSRGMRYTPDDRRARSTIKRRLAGSVIIRKSEEPGEDDATYHKSWATIQVHSTDGRCSE